MINPKTISTLWLFFVLMSCSVFAQQQRDEEVTLVTRIGDVRSIVVNQSQFNVNMTIDDWESLMNGKSMLQVNHLQVTSTSDYQIEVVATSELQSEKASIPVNTVQIIPSYGDVGQSFAGSIQFSPVALSTQNQSIIQSSKGDAIRTFDIAYELSSWYEYIKNRPPGIYRTTITYSIVAD